MADESELLRAALGNRNKAEFARTYGVPGGASMVSQHLSGNRPISLEAAIAYAQATSTAAALSARRSPELDQALPVVLARLPGGGHAHRLEPSVVGDWLATAAGSPASVQHHHQHCAVTRVAGLVRA